MSSVDLVSLNVAWFSDIRNLDKFERIHEPEREREKDLAVIPDSVIGNNRVKGIDGPTSLEKEKSKTISVPLPQGPFSDTRD
jgi:hypothetical protein